MTAYTWARTRVWAQAGKKAKLPRPAETIVGFLDQFRIQLLTHKLFATAQSSTPHRFVFCVWVKLDSEFSHKISSTLLVVLLDHLYQSHRGATEGRSQGPTQTC